eukprot:Polyplicarium_translucidae@DN3290_c0_g1_i6.p1
MRVGGLLQVLLFSVSVSCCSSLHLGRLGDGIAPAVRQPVARVKNAPPSPPPTFPKNAPPSRKSGTFFFVTLGNESKRIYISPERPASELVRLSEVRDPQATLYFSGRALDGALSLKQQGVRPGSVLRLKLSYPPPPQRGAGMPEVAPPAAVRPSMREEDDDMAEVKREEKQIRAAVVEAAKHVPSDGAQLVKHLMPRRVWGDIFTGDPKYAMQSIAYDAEIKVVETRMHAVFALGMDLFVLIVALLTLSVKALLWSVDAMKRDPFVLASVGSVSRSIAVTAIAALASWMVFSNRRVHEVMYREVFFPEFGELTPSLQDVLVAPLVADCVRIAVVYTFVYIASAVTLGIAMSFVLRWIRRAEVMPLRKAIDQGSWHVKMYKLASFEFQEQNQARIVPGVDPEGQHFGLYMHATISLTLTHPETWWKTGPWPSGFWVLLLVLTPFFIQLIVLPYLLYDTAYATETGMLLDKERMETVWQRSRFNAIGKFNAAVDRLSGEAYVNAATGKMTGRS